MKKIWMKILAVATFPYAVYLSYQLTGSYYAVILGGTLLLFAARGIEKYYLEEDQTFFSWIKKKI